MKKVMLGLVMVVMLMSMVGCGETTKTLEDKKEGFVPEQVTESEVVTDEVVEEVEEIIDTENLQKYYDPMKCVGTPRLATMKSSPNENNEVVDLVEIDAEGNKLCQGSIKMVGKVSDWLDEKGMDWKTVQAIVCDNNTPDDYTDDIIAYVFTE